MKQSKAEFKIQIQLTTLKICFKYDLNKGLLTLLNKAELT